MINLKGIGAMALLACLPSAAQDLAKGRELYAICSSCHGDNGLSTTVPQYPKIAGQNKAYLINALKAYRDGKRQGTYAAIMTASAKSLTDEEIGILVEYIASFD